MYVSYIIEIELNGAPLYCYIEVVQEFYYETALEERAYMSWNYLDPPRSLMCPAAAFENKKQKQNKRQKNKT